MPTTGNCESVYWLLEPLVKQGVVILYWRAFRQRLVSHSSHPGRKQSIGLKPRIYGSSFVLLGQSKEG